MSCSYADGLSPYEHKGKLGQAEIFDSPEEVDSKVEILARWISKESSHTVFYTGAGISTSAGIPDFRGPKGVWTLEKKGMKPDINVSWNDATPTASHMAIAKLLDMNLAQFVISQNIDGLHMRSGILRRNVAELHGNMFIDACKTCRRMFVRDSPAPTVGLKFVGKSCPATRTDICSGGNKRGNCRGKLIDFVLDWEDELPEADLILSDGHSTLSELSIVIGSTLQIVPAGNMPAYTKKYQGGMKDKGKLVIINLQPTKQDKKADLLIRAFSDTVMEKLFDRLGAKIPSYNPLHDPVKIMSLTAKTDKTLPIEWTQSSTNAKEIQKLSSAIEDKWKEKRRSEKLNSNKAAFIKRDLNSENSVNICDTKDNLEQEAITSDRRNIGDKFSQQRANGQLEGSGVKKAKLSDDEKDHSCERQDI